jgi:asparagine synthase (glutamine-hydrolysing)
MPGITGIISAKWTDGHSSIARDMTNAMMHESSYVSGVYANNSLGISIGWVCHPNSFADCMPIWNETRDICLIFAGEEFRDKSDVEHLLCRGHAACRSDKATYLVHLYEDFGPAFFEKLNGWFSGLLIDLRQRVAVLFNDRYGLQRLYYHQHRTGFYFSSEAKSLLSVLPELRAIDYASLGEVFSHGCVLGNRTLFRNIALLPPVRAGLLRRTVA